MKRLPLASAALLALPSAASAADLPRRAAPPTFVAAAPVFAWTGFYVGVTGLGSATTVTLSARKRTFLLTSSPLVLVSMRTALGRWSDRALVQSGPSLPVSRLTSPQPISTARYNNTDAGPVVDTRVSSEMNISGR